MCGEHAVVLTRPQLEQGSSPHVRGAQHPNLAVRAAAGIIPACAGSTNRTARGPVGWRDHPRMCGEHMLVDGFNDLHGGSSPHVRGALQAPVARLPRRGIIPACAGSTPCGSPSGCRFGDHPRMCGEHKILTAPILYYLGSSPHVRGAPPLG